MDFGIEQIVSHSQFNEGHQMHNVFLSWAIGIWYFWYLFLDQEAAKEQEADCSADQQLGTKAAEQLI